MSASIASASSGSSPTSLLTSFSTLPGYAGPAGGAEQYTFSRERLGGGRIR
jgi:hypothetical protein